VRETNRIDFWDFAFQQNTPVNYTIEPGDRISTHCVYNRGNKDVPFAEASDDEMCIQYVFYYPKIQIPNCGYWFNGTLNSTLCGTSLLPISNPSILDPIGGTATRFGAAAVCSTKNTDSEHNLMPGNKSNRAAAAIFAILFVVIIVTILILIFIKAKPETAKRWKLRYFSRKIPAESREGLL